MSEWKPFFADFPSRVRTILDTSFQNSVQREVDVTFLLVIASAGLTIPFERLRKKHPSGDAVSYNPAAGTLEKLLRTRFIGSLLWPHEYSASWRYYSEMENIDGRPERWKPPIGEAKKFSKINREGYENRSCNTVIHHIRNALAHANIFSFDSPISELIFLSKIDVMASEHAGEGESPPAKYSLIKVSPSDFHTFLRNWFAFLAMLHPGLSESVMEEK